MERVLKRRAHLAGEGVQGIVECRYPRSVVVGDRDVILEPRTDPRLVERDRNAKPRQERPVADTGELQQLRGIDRSGREDHLAARANDLAGACFQELDRACGAALEPNPGHERARHHPKVGARARGLQVRARRRHTYAAAYRHLPKARAFARLAVEVGRVGDAPVATGGDERLAQRVHLVAHVADVKRPSRAVVRGCPPRVILGFAKVRQHLRPGPAAVAGGRPVVEIARLAAQVHHRVDRA